MAYVTRCPYCGSVWLMPDKETADRTPVKCPDCNHSFDATCSLTAVPDSLFPGRVPVMLQGSGMPAAATDKKEPFSVIPEIAAEEKPEAAPESTEESAPDFADAAPQTPQADTAESTPKEAAAPEGEDQPRAAHENPAEAEPEKASAPAQKAEPAQSTQPEQPAPIAGVPLAKPETKLNATATALSLMQKGFSNEPRLGNLSSLQSAVAGNGTPKLKIEAEVAQATDSAAHGAPTKAGRKKRSGAGSLILTVIVLVAIACVAAVIFNQRLMAAFPQTEPYFDNVCRTIPCPGFYLHQIESFVVSKTNLRPLDESGNYALEVTVVNGSSTAQAVPDLQIELVDDNDGSLLRKTLTPPEFLDPGQADESIAARGQLTVRVNLQTNVTPARCIVTPVYSKQQK
ncbi:zinc-ribbon and DUF3426 domain-containing protein [Duodenibacillus massiliensis]|uniref:zinc-ribbon and DUF3426 domain-containing protein n=1 Tax=Duodenibacillus massiliensis TaxID=1852381 RepID=UPI0023A80041|nr:DUF3426 domain-containing protein [Duodenibacillus massiliensis]